MIDKKRKRQEEIIEVLEAAADTIRMATEDDYILSDDQLLCYYTSIRRAMGKPTDEEDM